MNRFLSYLNFDLPRALASFGWVLLAFVLYALPICSSAQGSKASAVAQAQAFFDSGKYALAHNVLLPVMQESESDLKVCFLFGASSAMAGVDVDLAINKLRFVQQRNYQKNEAYLYLGRAYQFACDFEQAQTMLEKFLKVSTDEGLRAVASGFLSECQSSIVLASKIFSVKNVGTSILMPADLLKAYHASADVGAVCRNSAFFQSDIDPDGLLYMTEKSDVVYFSLPDDEGNLRLRKVEKLIGGWSDMSLLPGIVSEASEHSSDQTPFLMTDGQTLYFASNRPGGLGGYDIYTSTYDVESHSFSEPRNMGVPFNSAYDDFLFVADEGQQRAWFASNRGCGVGADSVAVFEIVWDESVVRSMARSTADIRNAISMPESSADVLASEARKVAGEGVHLVEQFRFVVCDSLTYTQWEHFRSANAGGTFRRSMQARAERDSVSRVMDSLLKRHTAATSVEQKNSLLQEILAVERQKYALEDKEKDLQASARNQEISALRSLIADGKYVPLAAIKIKSRSRSIDWRRLLRPRNFASYSDAVFRDIVNSEDDELLALLSASQRRALAQHDTAFAWAHILQSEADAISQQAHSGQMPSALADDGSIATLSASQALRRAEEFRQSSAILASQALLGKQRIFAARLVMLMTRLSSVFDISEVEEMVEKADHYFDIVSDVDVSAVPSATSRDAINMRTRGVQCYEKALLRIVVHQDGTFPLPPRGNAPEDNSSDSAAAAESVEPQPSPQPAPQPMPQKDEAQDHSPAPAPKVVEKKVPEPVKSRNEASPVAEKPVVATHRIQLGAFRNRPAAINSLPSPELVVAEPINDNRGLSRYFYGRFASEAQARAALPGVLAAGFDAARVVPINAVSK